MGLNKNLLRRFGGNSKAAAKYAQDHKMDLHDMNAAAEAADRTIVYSKTPKIAHKRPHHPKFHKLGR